MGVNDTIEKILEQIKQPLWENWYIKERIGSGTFSAVYRAEAKRLDRTDVAAVKIEPVTLGDQLVQDPTRKKQELDRKRKELAKEADIMLKLRECQNIVRYEEEDTKELYIDGEFEGYYVLIRMELLENVYNLMMRRKMDLSEANVMKLAKDIGNALKAAHSQNIIHRDVKPANFFVAKDGTFKLGDFNISKKSVATRSLAGTPGYIAPEIYRAKENERLSYTAQADIYSLGICLYQMMNGGLFPFEERQGTSQDEAIDLRMQGTKLSLPKNASPEFGRIILKACTYETANRYQTIDEMLQDIEQYQMGKVKPASQKPDTNKTLYAGSDGEKKTLYAGDEDAATGEGGGILPKGKKKIFLIGGVAALIVLLVLLLSMALGGKDNGEEAENRENASVTGEAEPGKTTEAPTTEPTKTLTSAPTLMATQEPTSAPIPTAPTGETTMAPTPTVPQEPTFAPTGTPQPEISVGDGKKLCELKITDSDAFSFDEAELVDTIGNVYTGENVANLKMTYQYSGYVDYYLGGEYQYLSGVVAANDISHLLRNGMLKIYTKENDGDWYLLYETMTITRDVAPFELNIDITDAEWLRMTYENVDGRGGLNEKYYEAALILSDFAVTKEKREFTSLPRPAYGDTVEIAEMKVSRSEYFSFATEKQVDTVGNEYIGTGIGIMTMSYQHPSYADFYVGKEYQYLSGVIAPSDTSHNLRTGQVLIYGRDNEEEENWYQIYSSNTIDRSLAPYELQVDISGYDWIRIQYEQTDGHGDIVVKYYEASLLLSDFAFSKEVRTDLSLLSPEYGESPQISKVKLADSNAFAFATSKLTDTIGNDYTGRNIANMTMSYQYSGYADYYTGGKYQYLTGIVSANDTSHIQRTGMLSVYTKQNGGEWNRYYSTPEIDRSFAPYEIAVDISDADWIRIQYEHLDDYGDIQEKYYEAAVILSDLMFCDKIVRGELPKQEYGEEPALYEMKKSQSNAFAFATEKQTDTVGNDYTGRNVATVTMNYQYSGYVDYFVGGEYQKLSGVVAPNDTSDKIRTGMVIVYAKKNGEAWLPVYESKEINRTTAPFQLEVDISGADWIRIQYEHSDGYGGLTEKYYEASLILSDFKCSK